MRFSLRIALADLADRLSAAGAAVGPVAFGDAEHPDITLE